MDLRSELLTLGDGAGQGRGAATVERHHPTDLDAIDMRHDPHHPATLAQALVVTIDGPAASGKSAVAKRVAELRGLKVLNTGAMYRCATAIALEFGIPLEHVKRLLEVVRSAKMHFDWKASPPEVHAFHRSYAARATDPEVTKLVTYYSDIRELRELLVGMQRDIAKAHPYLVAEGRDQGSIVFPDADVKFYLTASVQERARRRRDQLRRDKGIEASLEDLMREIQERDANDSKREFGRLVQPEDAIFLDNTAMNVHETALWMDEQIRLRKGR